MTNHVLSISQINEYIRGLMDRDAALSSVYVRGEISNYKVYPSGHHYFTLKDENAALKCVMFRSSTVRLRFRPENGMKVIAGGKISVYPRDGAYQLYCTAMISDGVGDLHIAFEQLKEKLAAQGLFNPEHKKKIPHYPGTIGIITSSAGAAVHDILRILRKRFPLSRVRLFPVRVQGVEAPEEIAGAIRYVNYYQLADVLIVGRGGGSIEDLWAFNDERVARAIYGSEVPVISAVGHEPDVTISDFVADLRAATPSNAAELVVPDQQELREKLQSLQLRMRQAMTRQMKLSRSRLEALQNKRVLQSPLYYVQDRRLILDYQQKRLISSMQRISSEKKQSFIRLTAALDAMSPLKVLARGYSVTKDSNGIVLTDTASVQLDDLITITLQNGEVDASVREIRGGKYE